MDVESVWLGSSAGAAGEGAAAAAAVTVGASSGEDQRSLDERRLLREGRPPACDGAGSASDVAAAGTASPELVSPAVALPLAETNLRSSNSLGRIASSTRAHATRISRG